MKIQDILFVIALVFLISRRDPKFFTLAGLASLVLAIPLFNQWIFFTAQRLVLYAFIFFTISVIIHIIQLRRKVAS